MVTARERDLPAPGNGRETIARSMAAGAVGFIVKPFTREGLLAKLGPFVR